MILASVVTSLVASVVASLVVPTTALPPDRGDLGIAYQRFERAVARAPKDPATRRKANMAFDSLTTDFFAGRFDRALARLAAIEADLAGEADADPSRAERAYLAGHRIEVEPRLGEAVSTRAFRVRARQLDRMEAGLSPSHVVLRQGEREIAVAAGGLSAEGCTVAVDPPLAPGAVEVALRMPQLGEIPVGRAFLLDAAPGLLRAALAERIAAAKSRGDLDASTLASLEARHELAFGEFDRAKSADLLADPTRLAASLEQELATASRGGRPYAGAGDVWRVMRVLGVDMPVRQFVPPGEGPFPLIIALHGAGGDENLFFDGYGGGRLLEVARERGIAVVCPPTIPFGISPNVLPKFLEALAKDVPFDASRVGLVGHSLGAVTASRLAVLRPESINGAVCIAGYADLPRKVKAPPRMVYLAELDPLFALDGMRASIEGAKARGDDIDLVVVPNEGHTLVVGEVIDQAVAWLLARPACTTAPTKPTASAPSTIPMNTGVPKPAESDAKPSAGPTK